MRFAIAILLIMQLLLPVTGFCAAFQNDEFNGTDRQSPSEWQKETQGDEDATQTPRSGAASERQRAGSPAAERSRAGSPQTERTRAGSSAKEPGESGMDDELEGKSRKLQLRGEPGDAEIFLSWYLPEQRGRKPSSFVIYYSSDTDHVEKKQDMIKGSPYRLRGLKNGQLYQVRVAAFGRDGKEVASSDELSLTPRSLDELSSPLERSFSRSLLALSQKPGADRGGSRVDGADRTSRANRENGEQEEDEAKRAREFNEDQVRREIKQFGYDFFPNSGAASSDNIPVGADYVVGPGDALRIDMWGSLQARYDLMVDRSGEITIPRVGAVKVWGLSYSQLRTVVDKAVSRYFKGYELNVTLGKLRSIQVFVVGEVHAPGAYMVNSLATTINALSAAGGPTKNGSLRQIRLVRGGKTVQEIDLYSMFLSGDRSLDVRVENGDTLLVPVIGRVAAVAGEVKRPAIYELKGETSLPALLEMAGGITAAGDKARIQVERLEGNSARVVIDHLPKGKPLEKELSGVAISDRDMVKVFPFYDETRRVVTLKGNVARPGEYQYREGMTLKDLIPDYNALLPETYLGAVEITRLELPDRHREMLSANLGQALAGDAKENVALKEQDTVMVFSHWHMQERPMVSVSGQVVKPGEYRYYPNMTVRDLVTAAGSLKRNALLGDAELTRIEVKGGVAVSARLNLDLKKVLAGDPGANITLQPDDMLIVRSITQWLETEDRFVTLKGEVKYPGTYSIAKGERLSSVITRAGGFTDRAYLRGARFTRKSVQKMQQKRMDEVIARSEQDILKKQSELSALASSPEDLAATKSSLDALLKGLETLKQTRAEGRIVITVTPPEQLAKTDYDLELMGGDKLDVPLTPSVVSVLGQVYNPTTFVYREGNSVSAYLKKSGGPIRDADTSEMYMVRADGTVVSRQQSSFGFSRDDGEGWNWGGFMSRPLLPGDTLVVPQKLERTAWLRELKDITTIVSQVALTAGTVFLFLK